MANSYQLSRPEHWDPLGRAGLETHLEETEAALNDLEGALNNAANRLDESINMVSSTLDGKITALSTTLERKISTLSSTLEGKINAVAAAKEVIVGTYTGNGAASKNISLGFRPRAVLAEDPRGLRYSNGRSRGTLVVDGMPATGEPISLVITATGFQAIEDSDGGNMNVTGYVYSYLVVK